MSPKLEDVRPEFERARAIEAGLHPSPKLDLVVSGNTGQGPFGSEGALSAFLSALADEARLAPEGPAPDFDF